MRRYLCDSVKSKGSKGGWIPASVINILLSITIQAFLHQDTPSSKLNNELHHHSGLQTKWYNNQRELLKPKLLRVYFRSLIRLLRKTERCICPSRKECRRNAGRGAK